MDNYLENIEPDDAEFILRSFYNRQKEDFKNFIKENKIDTTNPKQLADAKADWNLSKIRSGQTIESFEIKL